MKHKFDQSFLATMIVVIFIFFISFIEYTRLKDITLENNYRYLDETLLTASTDFEQRIIEDRNVLLTLADLVASYDKVDSVETALLVKRFTPHTISSRIAVLLPNDSIITISGTIEDSGLSFNEIANRGASIGKVDSGKLDGKLVLRNFVPVVKAGQTVAMLYGVIVLDDLPEKWQCSVLDGEGYICIVDGSTGQFIYDNLHEKLGNIDEYPDFKVLANRVNNISKGSDTIRVNSISGKCYVSYNHFADIDASMIIIIPTKSAYYQSTKTKNVLLVSDSIVAIGIGIYLVWLLQYTRKKNQENQETAHLADHDKLTCLYNRKKFDEIGHQLENGFHFALILIDVDKFKEINDGYGHLVGDEILSHIGNVLSETFGERDYPCRYGGDEFAVIMPGYTPRQKNEISNYIYRVRSKVANTQERLPSVTLSIGIAFSDAICSLDEVFRMADAALYNIKENGRNGYDFGSFKKIKEIESTINDEQLENNEEANEKSKNANIEIV